MIDYHTFSQIQTMVCAANWFEKVAAISNLILLRLIFFDLDLLPCFSSPNLQKNNSSSLFLPDASSSMATEKYPASGTCSAEDFLVVPIC